jgi:hypothetical protein
VPFLRDAALDLRHAARSIRTQPGFAGVVIATTALVIGATALLTSDVSSHRAVTVDPAEILRAE